MKHRLERQMLNGAWDWVGDSPSHEAARLQILCRPGFISIYGRFTKWVYRIRQSRKP